ncbi:MAG: protein BatD [Candidatus Margulisbacteria bacterium]|nr:protein BatD [Candidatus Margulisiibacteriota bacterium]
MVTLNRIIVGLLIFISASVYATEISLTSKVNRSELSLNNKLIYEIHITGKDIAKVPNPKIPNLSENFVVVSQSDSTSFSWINGSVSSTRKKSIILRPLATGTHTIGAATLTYKGKTLRSEPIRIEVTNTQQSVLQAPPPVAQQAPSFAAPNTFVKAVASKKSVYIGEEVVYQILFYRRVQLWSDVVLETPEIKGFWIEKLPRSQSQTVVETNGVKYYQMERYKVSLFPLETGTFTIPITRVGFVLDPFKGQQVLQTNPVSIRVKPLPVTKRPNSFSGIVGQLSMSVSVNQTTVTQNMPVSIAITVKGSGYLKNLKDLLYTSSDALKIYKSKIEDRIGPAGQMEEGSRVFHYFAIPKQSGNLTIPGFSTNYFSPRSKLYYTIRTQPIPLKVMEVEGNALLGTTSIPQNSIKVIKEDISYLKPFEPFKSVRYLSRSMIYIGLILLNTFIFIFLIWGKVKPYILSLDQAHRKRAMAYKQALQLLTNLRASSSETNAVSQTSQIILTYLSLKTQVPFSGLTTDGMSDTLRKQHVNEHTIKKFLDCQEALSFYTFTPPSHTSKDSVMSLIQLTQSVIMDLEKALS